MVAHDLHPEYLSTKYAQELEGVRLIGVQHHHAHLAACLAEHGESGPALGAIFDGTGFGSDGSVWGGELLLGDLAGFERVGHLLAGADAGRRGGDPPAVADGVRRGSPPRYDAPPERPPALADSVDPDQWRQVAALAKSGLASPLTSSVGRLFDAVAALCGIRAAVNYEGQAAIELEAACDPDERAAYPLPLSAGAGPLMLDPRPALRALVEELARRRAGGRGGGALPQHDGRAPARARLRAARRAPRGRERGAVGGRVPEPAAARVDGAAS